MRRPTAASTRGRRSTPAHQRVGAPPERTRPAAREAPLRTARATATASPTAGPTAAPTTTPTAAPTAGPTPPPTEATAPTARSEPTAGPTPTMTPPAGPTPARAAVTATAWPTVIGATPCAGRERRCGPASRRSRSSARHRDHRLTVPLVHSGSGRGHGPSCRRAAASRPPTMSPQDHDVWCGRRAPVVAGQHGISRAQGALAPGSRLRRLERQQCLHHVHLDAQAVGDGGHREP